MRTNINGFGFPLVLLSILVVLLIAGAGFLVYQSKHNQPHPLSQTAGNKPDDQQLTTNTSPNGGQTDPYMGWLQYCSKLEKSCFKYPSGWKTASFEVADPNGEGFSVTSPDDSIAIFYSSVVSGLGGGCGNVSDTVVNSSVKELSTIKGIGVRSALYKNYNPSLASDQTTYRVVVGLTDNLKDEAVGSSVSCQPAPTFQSKNQTSTPSWSIGFTNSLKGGFDFQSFKSQTEAQNLMSSQTFSTAEKILESYSY